jgi:large subunit ribosomal protein L13
MQRYTLDANGKKLGRLASEAAILLMGKQLTNFTRNRIPDVLVSITNASKADIGEKKMSQKSYEHYSGYPSGRRVLSAREVVERKGYRELFRRAVYGMLPTNTLRSKMIKRLVVTE